MTVYVLPQNQYINTWISQEYCKDWKIWEAIREILQNQLDGIAIKIGKSNIEIEKQYPPTPANVAPTPQGVDAIPNYIFKNRQTNEIMGEIIFDEINDTLSIWNKGSLETGNLLLGGNKDIINNQEVIGRFGEGMKLSALAFVRQKKDITISTKNVAWRFCLKEDKNFVLDGKPRICLHWRGDKWENQEYNDKVFVQIEGITKDEWAPLIHNFLWLTTKNTGRVSIKKNDGKELGEILLNPYFEKKFFVKDIYIQTTSGATDCVFGFNTDLGLDRDRNCVPDLNQRNYRTSEMLAYIISHMSEIKPEVDINWVAKFKELPNVIFNTCLKANMGVTHYFHSYVNVDGADIIWKEWEKKFPGLQPVTTDNLHSVNNFIRDKKLPADFYKYSTSLSWQQWHTLIKSRNYISVQKKFDNLVKAAPEINAPQNFAQIIDEICNKIKVVRNDFVKEKIKFKNYAVNFNKEMCYFDSGNCFFSSLLFNDQPSNELKRWMFKKVMELLSVRAEEVIEKFNLI